MIFISYRHSDSRKAVNRLDVDLVREFGRSAVFRDQKRLQGGDDWPNELERHARDCSAMLVVIGSDWQKAAYADDYRKGELRLDDSEDWVRKEISIALRHDRVVIPLLLDDTQLPSRKWLERRGLAKLADKQSLIVRDDLWESDLARLISHVHAKCPALRAQGPVHQPTAIWTPAVMYPLQPAPNFAGRDLLLADLVAWVQAVVDRKRVVALVAAGGTGKTAVAAKLLQQLPTQLPYGVFVWSFYENPQTEMFLRAAYEYFTGKSADDAGGLFERTQRALAGDQSHLFILDGMELMQGTGTTGRPRGEIEDPLLRRLIRWIAAGKGTAVRALITTRFPLPDLQGWNNDGFTHYDLADLDAAAARAILRKWQVKGSDKALDKLASDVHCHALSIDILGSYIGLYCNGDPKKAPKYNPKDWADTDPKAAKLNRILTSYSEKLTSKERDLLSRLSLFPRGVCSGPQKLDSRIS